MKKVLGGLLGATGGGWFTGRSGGGKKSKIEGSILGSDGFYRKKPGLEVEKKKERRGQYEKRFWGVIGGKGGRFCFFIKL
ncbi:hypothetical protein AACA75_00020 [Enterococcus faecalis]|uniref:hypothetical protein n=1 Tax=Enterococcus faecalis TaxID=1351 RepID=UPI003178A3A8